MRVLVTANGAAGHLFPLVPTLFELKNADHEVLVACPGTAANAIAGHFSVRQFKLDEVRVPDFPASADRHERFMFAVCHRWPTLARGWAGALLEEVREWRPDLVVAEPTEHAARVAAATLDVPWVEHGWGFSLPAAVDKAAYESISDLYTSLGASPRPSSARVDLGPQALQPDDARTMPRFRYRPWSPDAPPLPPPRRNSRVLITLGTYSNPSAADRLAQTARAAVKAGAEPVVALGQRDVGDQRWPDEALIADWINTPFEIARCQAAVHHGGAGTSYAALDAGIPAVCMPQMGDQFRNAELLANAGVCLTADAEHTSEVQLTELITRALNDSALAAAVRVTSRQNEKLPDIPELVQSLADAVT